MAKKVVCIWEIGAGLGHLTRLRPIIQHATKAGHQVFLVAKQLQNIHTIFDIQKLAVLQAPYENTPAPRKVPISWCEMLLLRYQNADRLANQLAAWRSIFDLIEPDLVVYDSAPTALIASLGGRWCKWTVGSPFFMPRIDTAQVGVFPNTSGDAASLKRLQRSEQALLNLISKAQERLDWDGRVERVHDVLAQADLEMVTTLPQFDYLGTRQIGEYVGMPASVDGKTCKPAWPVGSKPKVFAYLKTFPGMRTLLEALNKADASTIIYSRDISAADRKKFDGLVYLDEPASMDAVCAEADLVIHMAGSQTVARCMSAGVTQLLIANAMEQLFTAKAAQQLGAAFVIHNSSANFELLIRQALLHARKGRRPFADASSELLDGSFYDSRIASALAEFEAR